MEKVSSFQQNILKIQQEFEEIPQESTESLIDRLNSLWGQLLEINATPIPCSEIDCASISSIIDPEITLMEQIMKKAQENDISWKQKHEITLPFSFVTKIMKEQQESPTYCRLKGFIEQNFTSFDHQLQNDLLTEDFFKIEEMNLTLEEKLDCVLTHPNREWGLKRFSEILDCRPKADLVDFVEKCINNLEYTEKYIQAIPTECRERLFPIFYPVMHEKKMQVNKWAELDEQLDFVVQHFSKEQQVYFIDNMALRDGNCIALQFLLERSEKIPKWDNLELKKKLFDVSLLAVANFRTAGTNIGFDDDCLENIEQRCVDRFFEISKKIFPETNRDKTSMIEELLLKCRNVKNSTLEYFNREYPGSFEEKIAALNARLQELGSSPIGEPISTTLLQLNHSEKQQIRLARTFFYLCHECNEDKAQYYNDQKIQDLICAIHQFPTDKESNRFLDILFHLPKSQLNDLQLSLPEVVPNKTRKIISLLLTFVGKNHNEVPSITQQLSPNIYKDNNRLNSMLKAVLKLCDESIAVEKKIQIFSELVCKPRKETQSNWNRLHAILTMYPDWVNTVNDNVAQAMTEFLNEKMQEQWELSHDKIDNFLKLDITDSLNTYYSKLLELPNEEQEIVIPLLKQYVQSVSEESPEKKKFTLFRTKRYDCQYLNKFSLGDPGLIDTWKENHVEQKEGDCCAKETDDPVDLFLAGTRVDGSCQNINGSPGLNKCLLGYVLNGHVKELVVEENGETKARAMIKMLTTDDGKPVLLLEPTYYKGHLTEEKKTKYDEMLKKVAVDKATSLNVTLLSMVDKTPKFGLQIGIQNLTGFEYSDALKGQQKGSYNVPANKLHIIYDPNTL